MLVGEFPTSRSHPHRGPSGPVRRGGERRVVGPTVCAHHAATPTGHAAPGVTTPGPGPAHGGRPRRGSDLGGEPGRQVDRLLLEEELEAVGTELAAHARLLVAA